MSLFKCKMCGGDLEIADGVSIAECEYCGTKQTVPKAMDENMQNLFNRANTLRIKSEFDKAEKLYEKIIQSDTTQSEAYWGLILCKYGIEYVDDPATFKKIPTCHRASYDSIIADEDYKSALENADLTQRAVYEEQAREIDRIQKDILALAQKEETYDVFICYKETDANGQRTHDSVIANDIYYQLTQEGFKVFYAAITLEGKLGSAYEPIIFAALNSAKVMLAIGTKPEYFNAVWVKNEWSRFLKIIKKDRSKLLIPCYRDMDAYELPDEFAHLQAQDMAKIGFINDVVRGIKKVIVKDEPKATTVVKETVVTGGNSNIATLLKRVFIFLEDGDWEGADEYAEKVLDIDPECGEAYLGKLMAELKVRALKDLNNYPVSFDNRGNYKRAWRYGDAALKAELSQYAENVNSRSENEQREKLYKEATDIMVTADSSEKYNEAASIFGSISMYKDAEALKEKCLERAAEEKAREIEEKNRVLHFKDIDVKIGGVIGFGKYKQSSVNSLDSEIVWKIIDIKNSKALLISNYALECRRYNARYEDVSWEECTLRKWLNNDFVDMAFSEEEKAMMVLTDMFTSVNLNSDGEVKDKVFLLSKQEADKYFSSDFDRQCKPTDRVAANVFRRSKNNCRWWLRSTGNQFNRAVSVDADGKINAQGDDVNYVTNAVRPAMWIDFGI